MKKLHDEILKWFADGADFDRGIMLFGQTTRNHYYVNNIAKSRRDSSLRYELGKVLVKAGVVKKEPKVGTLTPSSPPKQYPLGPADHSPLEPPLSANDASHTLTFPPKRGNDKEGILLGEKEKNDEKTPSVGLRTVPTQTSPPKRGENEEEKIVLRDKFPFLNEPDCPDELKILVADSITSHRKYVEGHEKLFLVAHKGKEECFEVAAETVENYLKNKAIWKELEYYKKHKKILGEHPLFEKKRKAEELLSMGLPELKRKKENLNRQLKYRQDKLKKKGSDKAVINEEMARINSEIDVVENLIQKREN